MTSAGKGTDMLAEIREQPDVLREVCRRARDEWRVPKSLVRGVSSAVFVGSGSSFNAGLLAARYLETIAGIPSRVDLASEAFRSPVPGRPLAVGLSHSGSSADVRGALKRAKTRGYRTLALTNIDDSPLTRDADAALVTGAGIERAVPSTKGFTALVAGSLLLASSQSDSATAGGSAASMVKRAANVIATVAVSGDLVARASAARTIVFLGERSLYPVARDGALKFLEITYIPALGYPPDEFRHGPIALAERGVAIVALERLPKTLAEIARRAGADVMALPLRSKLPRLARPLVRAVELQLLAHGVGVRLGRDVDQPRSLSKVVT